MATIYTIVGEPEKAIEELEIVLSNPAWISVEYLKADPIFEPLHQNPRFLALLDKYSK